MRQFAALCSISILLIILGFIWSNINMWDRINKRVSESIEQSLVQSTGDCHPIWYSRDNNPRFVFPCMGEK